MLGIGAARYSIFDLIIFTPGGLGTASEKSVGVESVPTILDKCDGRYLTLSFPFGALGQGLNRITIVEYVLFFLQLPLDPTDL